MNRWLQLCIELVLASCAAFAAVFVRDNFEITSERFEMMVPFFVTAFVSAIVVFPAVGLHRGLWRFSSSAELPRLVAAAVGVTTLTLFAMFFYDRLASVPRSLPLLQVLFLLAMMCVMRVVARHRDRMRARYADGTIRSLQLAAQPDAQNAILIGLNRLAETYLQAVSELAPARIKIVGLLGRADEHVGREFGLYPIIGVPQDIDAVLRELEVHGVSIDKIVVASRREDLTPEAATALQQIARGSAISVEYLADRLGLTSVRRRHDEPAPEAAQASFRFSPDDVAAMSRRPYWRAKRVFDIVAATLALVVLAPVMAVIALGVALTIGRPITFWQQRPGRRGTPFRLYKFRSMAAAYDATGRRHDDTARTSAVGDRLRRTRLDELPQLVNVLLGHMSFVGPRPLLPRDQPEAFRARLLIRPGLTGWAQVVGGRVLSAEDKAALDIWYVRHASLRLDLEILLRTVPMVVRGERLHSDLVARAWSDLLSAGIVVGDLVALARTRAAP